MEITNLKIVERSENVSYLYVFINKYGLPGVSLRECLRNADIRRPTAIRDITEYV